jgi:hypothetical protein
LGWVSCRELGKRINVQIQQNPKGLDCTWTEHASADRAGP